MPRPKSDIPGYRLHKQSGRGYVAVDGRQKLLPGPFNSTVSRAAYDRTVADYLANGRAMPAEPATGPTVSMIALAFWKHVQVHYVHPDGSPTGEAQNYRYAIRPLRNMYGAEQATAFGPKMLRAFRSAMLRPSETVNPKTGKARLRPGWSRKYANRMTDRIRFLFKWAASEELISASVYHALATVDSIRIGREGARDTERVGPVEEAVVLATLPHMAPAVAALVKLQLATGARGGELFKIRPCDIDTRGDGSGNWTCSPTSHKTAHHGLGRKIRFGARAREVLAPFLADRPINAYLFSPAETVAWKYEQRRAARKTPVTPSQRLRAQQAGKRKRKTRPHYTSNSYGLAIMRACKKAGVAPWHAHQLRHTAGTAYRRAGDFEAAKIILGHKTDSMTEHYALRDERKAEEIVARIG